MQRRLRNVPLYDYSLGPVYDEKHVAQLIDFTPQTIPGIHSLAATPRSRHALLLKTCISHCVQRSSRAKVLGDVGFRAVNFLSWQLPADEVWTERITGTGNVSQLISGVFFPPLVAFCVPPSHALSKRRNGKGLASCSLHQGAVSHFGLEYGWQAKENKNHLHRRDAEEHCVLWADI